MRKILAAILLISTFTTNIGGETIEVKPIGFVANVIQEKCSNLEKAPDCNKIMYDRYHIEEPIKEKTPNKEKKKTRVYIGKFTLTAYCNCPNCCGKWAGGPCKNGEMPRHNYTLAVDTDLIPMNSKISIEGVDCIDSQHIFKAQDTGSFINGNHIDVYFDNHQSALNFGKKEADIYIIKDGE